MIANKRSQILWTISLALLLGPAFRPTVASGRSPQASAPMRQMATRAASGAIKLEVQRDSASAPMGSTVSLKIFMRNADNRAATWDHACTINLAITFPSRKVEKQTIVIPQGRDFVVAKFEASEYGVVHLNATESTDSLLGAGNTVFIFVPSSKSGKPAVKKPVPQGGSFQEFLRAPYAGPRLTFVSWNSGTSLRSSLEELQEPPAPAAAPAAPGAPPATPQLLLVNSTGKDEILADGKDFALINVYYMAPNGKGAPSDILLWMTWTAGTFTPQPMIIHKGDFAGEGKLVSASVVDATVSIVSSAPSVPIQGSPTLKVSFSPPIYGFGPATSDTTVTMSLIDRDPLVGCFFNDQGFCIQTDRKRQIYVSSSNPTLHVEPASLNVDANGGTATVFLQPTWRGTSTIDMWTDGYGKQRVVVQITIWLVVVLCVIGGIVGGIAARDTLRGSIWWRIFIGVVGAIVLVWMCVFIVIPKTHSMIAHSLISVLVVGIVGGYGGTRVLDFAAKKLGVLT